MQPRDGQVTISSVLVVWVSVAVLMTISFACGSSSGGGGGDAAMDGGGDATVYQRLPGSYDALAIDHIPNLEPPASSDEDWAEAPGGLFSNRYLVVAIEEDATVGEINDVLSRTGLQIVGGIALVGMLVLELHQPPADGSPTAVLDAMEQLLAEPAVAAAVVLQHHEFQYLAPFHPNTEVDWTFNDVTFASSGAWGLMFARVPYAWNIWDWIERVGAWSPQVAVIDGGFMFAHPDLNFNESPRSDDHPNHAHGTQVASVIGAKFDGFGVEGIVPLTDGVDILANKAYADDRDLWQMVNLIIDYDELRVLNYSIGDEFRGLRPEDVGPHWYSDQTYRDLADESGRLWNEIINRLARNLRNDFLITCAAGNAGVETLDGQSYTHLGRDVSGCCNAAMMQDNAYMFCVESLDSEGDNAARSAQGGNIAAPGDGLAMAMHFQQGQSFSQNYTGTSYSAPFVAGAAALLWTAEYRLTAAEVRNLLLSTAQTGLNGSAPRLDVYAALLAIDSVTRLDPPSSVMLRLADFDDGTADGNLRAGPGGSDVDNVHLPIDRSRGNNCVDMADFRALRDAILTRDTSIDSALDGSWYHNKLDHNGDGIVWGDPEIFDAWEDQPTEGMWSRFDLDGNQAVDTSDLIPFLTVWGRCEGDNGPVHLEGHDNSVELTQLVESADIWVVIPTDGTVEISVGGPVAFSIDEPEWREPIYEAYIVRTVPTSAEVEVCFTTADDARSCQIVDVQPGMDVWLRAFTSGEGDACFGEHELIDRSCTSSGECTATEVRFIERGTDITACTSHRCNEGDTGVPVGEGVCLVEPYEDGSTCMKCLPEDMGAPCGAPCRTGECVAGQCQCPDEMPDDQPTCWGYPEDRLGELVDQFLPDSDLDLCVLCCHTLFPYIDQEDAVSAQCDFLECAGTQCGMDHEVYTAVNICELEERCGLEDFEMIRSCTRARVTAYANGDGGIRTYARDLCVLGLEVCPQDMEETCDGSDDDCDTQIDEGSLCSDGESCVGGNCE